MRQARAIHARSLRCDGCGTDRRASGQGRGRHGAQAGTSARGAQDLAPGDTSAGDVTNEAAAALTKVAAPARKQKRFMKTSGSLVGVFVVLVGLMYLTVRVVRRARAATGVDRTGPAAADAETPSSVPFAFLLLRPSHLSHARWRHPLGNSIDDIDAGAAAPSGACGVLRHAGWRLESISPTAVAATEPHGVQN